MTASSLTLAVLALTAVLALIGLCARLMRVSAWRPGQRPGSTLVVRETVALDPRRRLHLVQCGNRQVVLLTGGAQDFVVGWMQEP